MSSNGRILLADDDRTFRLATAELFRRAGYHCDAVPDAPSALARLRADHYDVLVADIRMPGNEDLELVRQVAARVPPTPVVLVTAYPSIETAIHSVHLPVAAYVIKPAPFDRLLEWVGLATRWSRAARALHALDRTASGMPDELTGLLDDLRDALRIVTRRRPDGSAGPGPGIDVETLLSALEQTTATLHKTKDAFRSRDLGQLRQRLERLLDQARNGGAA